MTDQPRSLRVIRAEVDRTQALRAEIERTLDADGRMAGIRAELGRFPRTMPGMVPVYTRDQQLDWLQTRHPLYKIWFVAIYRPNTAVWCAYRLSSPLKQAEANASSAELLDDWLCEQENALATAAALVAYAETHGCGVIRGAWYKGAWLL